MKNNVIQGIVEFQQAKKLDTQPYDHINEAVNVFEEILESIGFKMESNKRTMLQDQLVEFVGSLVTKNIIEPEKEMTLYKRIDAHCDQIVLNVGALLKLSANPETALTETIKEINSRQGKIIDGKFVKDTSQEAKAKWYKADYSKALTLKRYRS